MILRLIFLITSPVAVDVQQLSVVTPSSEVEAVWIPDGWIGPVIAIPLDEQAFSAKKD